MCKSNDMINNERKKNSDTTKKPSCPSVFSPVFLQTVVINKPVPTFFENAGIGSPKALG